MLFVSLEGVDINKIYESGQCFGISVNPLDSSEYWCVSGSRFCRVVYAGECTSVLTCFEEDENYWLNYFDMDTDYESIALKYVEQDGSELSKEIIELGKGLRMLRQEFPDCLISFITSQRKSVPSIRTAISKFCETYGNKYNLADYYGEKYEGFEIYTFPDREGLSKVSEEGLADLGFGYRSGYIVSSINSIWGTEWEVDRLESIGYEEAKSQLMGLYGVGVKIANCVLLYSLGYRDAYPRDVWILRFENMYCNGLFDEKRYEGIAGILQLWQYYYMLHG